MKVFKSVSHAALLVMLTLCPAQAVEIVMSSGERFTSSEVWEEDGQIRFNMQGLMVSVSKSEVAEMITEPATLPPLAYAEFAANENHAVSGHQQPSFRDMGTAPIDAPRNSARALPSRPSSSKVKSAATLGIGLEGVSWRMPPQALPGLEKVKTDPAFGGIDQYRHPEQTLKLGEADLDGLVYGFWQNQLYSVMMWTKGRRGYERMKEEIFARYSQGMRKKPDIERYIWMEDKTQRMLEFDSTIQTGLFIMRSSELDAHIKERFPADRQP
ncbi:MAG: hypothetical protein VR64_02280 [Desulfatitalea sp. BRH_c12]|nr:MAG: hypothetical protein VR64_02280 [Desulfatitalea sp. BRH_c12]